MVGSARGALSQHARKALIAVSDSVLPQVRTMSGQPATQKPAINSIMMGTPRMVPQEALFFPPDPWGKRTRRRVARGSERDSNPADCDGR